MIRNTKIPRSVDIVVLSDVHLGTYGCHAQELAEYLESIDPELLILNGDIVDMWQFSKRYWPVAHTRVLELLLKKATGGTKVYYLTGNHDDPLRTYSPFCMGDFSIRDKLVLEIDGMKAWFFHGDVLDSVVLKAKWLARMGGLGYDLLILINRFANCFLVRLGRPRLSLSKRVKAGVKRAMDHVNKFEDTIAELAREEGFDWVFCGHIHEPQIKSIGSSKQGGCITYFNSGDWVENLTSLEYSNKEWSIYKHDLDADQSSFTGLYKTAGL
ncbi:UDP-2,3-diacylglucosamine diphosphatase [bacterium]|nr:UDP-2,3-diacylglucosamine diphosphatase [bacterium]